MISFSLEKCEYFYEEKLLYVVITLFCAKIQVVKTFDPTVGWLLKYNPVKFNAF